MADSAVDADKLTLYQQWHLGLTTIGLVVAFATLISVVRQVENLTAQTRRQTDAIDLQRRVVQGQTWSMLAQDEVELTEALIGNPQALPYFQRAKPISPRDRNLELVVALADMHPSLID